MASDTAPVAGTTSGVRPASLHTFHRNPRRGDIDSIAGSLKANGQFKPVVANIGTHTGRPNEVLAGNHTLAAFRQLAELNPFDLQWRTILVHWVDVDDDMANRIVLVDNRSFDAGDGIDSEIVLELLNDVGTTGTGYTDDALDALERAFNKTAPEVEPEDPDAAEPETPDLTPKEPPAIGFTLVFDDEEQQESWFAYVKKLRADYPDPDLTVAERLLAHLKATESERV